jgi:phospholipid/cholesterol/gamma-HCH transport system substrate-binding protein
MEKKANYALIGLFTLLVIAAGFGFVLWFEHLGSKKTRIGYRIIFEGPTVGLRVGANVNFNGIRIGEVDSVKIDDPQHVVALVSVERKAPVRKDTTVGLEFQGLTGIAAVALKGGSVGAPEVEPDEDGILTLTADSNSSIDLTESARAVLNNVNKVVSENEESIHDALKNVDEFSKVLARNSERLDNVLAGVDELINKDGTGEFQAAVKSFHTLSDNLDTRTADITAGVNKFTANGTKDVSQLISDARKTLADISKAFVDLDKNPSRLLFGGSPPTDSSSAPAARPRPAPASASAAPAAPAAASASADKPKQAAQAKPRPRAPARAAQQTPAQPQN